MCCVSRLASKIAFSLTAHCFGSRRNIFRPHVPYIRTTRQFAFHLFAVHNDEGGCLTPKLLGSFLGSFATVLCACTEEGMEMAPEMLRSVISAASETAVTSLLGGFVCVCVFFFLMYKVQGALI